jgi:hypothetical protein
MKKFLPVVAFLLLGFTANSFATKADPFTIKFVNVSSGEGTYPDVTSPMAVQFIPIGDTKMTCASGKCDGEFKKNDSFSVTFTPPDNLSPVGGYVKFSYLSYNPNCENFVTYGFGKTPEAQNIELRVFDVTQNPDDITIATVSHCAIKNSPH